MKYIELSHLNTILTKIKGYIDNMPGIKSTVSYKDDQSSIISTAEKAIARNNISAISAADLNNRLSNYVSYSSQTKTESEQAQARKNIMAGGSNKNLIDNSWFTINQRGWTTGNGKGGSETTLDRWNVSTAATITKNSSGTVTVSGGFIFQRIEHRYNTGDALTISYKKADGTIISRTGTVRNIEGYIIGDREFGLYHRINGSPIFDDFQLNCVSETEIVAMKIEKGTYSTLANDTPPDPAEELERCKYYFERIAPMYVTARAVWLGWGYSEDNYVYPSIHTHHKRATPVLIYSNIVCGQTSLNIPVTALSIYNSATDGTLILRATASGLSNATPYRFGIGENGYLDLNAEFRS